MNTTAIESDVMDVLRRSTASERLLVLPAQLDRKLYQRVDKVLKGLGGKWNTKAKGHLFERGTPAEILAGVVESGSFVDKKKAFGFFETPRAVAQRMLEIANVKPTDTVLEPSAGRGRLVEGLPMEQNIVAVELDPDNVVFLAALPRCHDRPGMMSVITGDFLDGFFGFKFDVVLMNPPFANNQDIRHVRKAWDCLKPGGRLVAITSPHWTFASDREATEFRDWIDTSTLRAANCPRGRSRNPAR